MTPIPPVAPDALQYVGHGLHRPECVLCTAAGDLYVSHWEGGVSRIAPDGAVTHIGTGGGGAEVHPNGIALCHDGAFLLADLGQGGVYRLSRTGERTPYVMEADGQPLHATNFVAVDAHERVWITVSTRQVPRQEAYRFDVADGYIVLADARGARIVADGLGFTNECHLAPGGEWLYVNETYGRRLTRFRVGADGTLSGREVVTTFGAGTFPDGLAFDAEGAVWVTSVVSNRLIRVTPDGAQQEVLADEDPEFSAAFERTCEAGALTRAHMEHIPTPYLKHCSSIAFGGPDLRTVYLGQLLDDRVAWLRSPVAGHPPVHWGWLV